MWRLLQLPLDLSYDLFKEREFNIRDRVGGDGVMYSRHSLAHSRHRIGYMT